MRIGVLLLLGTMLGLAQAAPSWFVGGEIEGAAGRSADNLVRYGHNTSPESGFQRVDINPDVYNDYEPAYFSDYINAMAAVPDTTGLMVGTCSEGVASFFSPNLAFYNGEFWVAVPDVPSDCVYGVDCTTTFDCFAVGSFEYVNSGGSSWLVNGIAHYVYEDSEWRFKNDLQGWAVNGSTEYNLVDSAETEEIVHFEVIGTDIVSYRFFVAFQNGDGWQSLWRGSLADDGWVDFTSNVPSGNIADISILEDTISLVQSDGTVLVTDELTKVVPVALEWTQKWAPGSGGPNITSCTLIAAYDDQNRYMACEHEPMDGVDAWSIFLQVGIRDPKPLGDPFVYEFFEGGRSSERGDKNVDPFIGLFISVDNEPIVSVRNEWAAFKLDLEDEDYYPGATVNYIATFKDDEWIPAFGGGTNDEVFIVTRSTIGEETYYYLMGLFTIVYDIPAYDAVWYDDDPALVQSNRRPWFPLIYRTLYTYSRTFSGVYAIANAPGDATKVFVAGSFNFIGGNQTVGSIISTTPVRDRASFSAEEVGGGVWIPTNYRGDWKYRAGTVLTMTFDPLGNLFVGGDFQRSKSGKCLGNIAVLRAGEDEFQKVGTGCEGIVSASIWWRDELIVAGHFIKCGGVVDTYRIASWTGDTWKSLNRGLYSPWSLVDPRKNFFSLVSMPMSGQKPHLVVGGVQSSMSGVATFGASAWDGKKWYPLVNDCHEPMCYEGVTGSIQPTHVLGITYSPKNKKLYALATVVADTEFTGFEEWPEWGDFTCWTACDGYYYVPEYPRLLEWDGSSWQIVSETYFDQFEFGQRAFDLAINGTSVLHPAGEYYASFVENWSYLAYDYKLKHHVNSGFGLGSEATVRVMRPVA